MDYKEVSKKVLMKWIAVPFSILVLVSATSSENLYYRWKSIASIQGYSPDTENWIFMVLLFGYMGCFPGHIVVYCGNSLSYIIA
jgi:hypothetical protein